MVLGSNGYGVLMVVVSSWLWCWTVPMMVLGSNGYGTSNV
jgi:hypothetical protein